MKTSILFIILISFSALSGTAQNIGLQLTKYKDQKTKYINEDSKIRIRLKNGGKIIIGRYASLNDSTILVQSYNDSLILVQSDTIGLKQISEIRVRPLSIIISGVALLGTGTLITAAGLALWVSLTAEIGGWGFIIGIIVAAPLAAVGAILATGGIIFLVHGKKYASSKWQYKLVKQVPFANSN